MMEVIHVCAQLWLVHWGNGWCLGLVNWPPTSQNFNHKSNAPLIHTVLCEGISLQTARTQQQIIGYPRLYYRANSFYSAGGYPYYALTGEPQSFPSWMATVCFSSNKAVVWSTAVLPTWFSHCLVATEHCHYNDGKCYIVIHNPHKLWLHLL